MKKLITLAVAMILVLAIGYNYAVEIVIFGPSLYRIKNFHGPEKYLDQFPGRIGIGKLIIKNGDESNSSRVAKAIVHFNGTTLFGPGEINPSISHLSAQVVIKEKNSITVEIVGRPGNCLTIEIREEINAVSSGPKAAAFRLLIHQVLIMGLA
jgi:hypothetical protein